MTAVAVGVDIGGTKTAVGVVDAERRVLARRSFATRPADGFAPAMDRVAATVQQLLAQVDAPAVAVGVGCAGPVDPVRGLVNNPHTLPGWLGCDIVTPLRSRLGVPVVLENDADAAAVGEWAVSDDAVDVAVTLTFGTGVGGAVLVHGDIYRGARGQHPEVGHLPCDPDGPPCYCGTRGCLEAMASGSALTRAAAAAGLADSRQLLRAAAAEEPAAVAVVARAAQAVRVAAWSLLHTFLPSRFILGGGVADSGYGFLAAAVGDAVAASRLVDPDTVTVRRAVLGGDAGMVGAAVLGLRSAGVAAP